MGLGSFGIRVFWSLRWRRGPSYWFYAPRPPRLHHLWWPAAGHGALPNGRGSDWSWVPPIFRMARGSRANRDRADRRLV